MQSLYDEMCCNSPVLEQPRDELLRAVRELAKAKEELDGLAYSQSGRLILSALSLPTDYSNTSWPYSFLCEVLPFFAYSQRDVNTLAYRKALVPSEMVVGDSWRWRPQCKKPEEQDRIIDKVFRAFAHSESTRAGPECANYTHIKPLGLVLAHEGRNRVALFRARGLPYIPAVVSQRDYVAPDRLRIFELPDAILAVLDNRYVERVKHLALVRPLLRAYGVKVEKIWSREYVPLDRIIDGFDKHRFDERRSDGIVDMEGVRIEDAINDTEVYVARIHIMNAPKPNLELNIAMLIILTGLIAAFRLSDGLSVLQAIFGTSMVFLLTFFFAPLMPIWKCKIKDLNTPMRWQHGAYIRKRITGRMSA